MKHKIKREGGGSSSAESFDPASSELLAQAQIPQFKLRGQNKFLEENEYKSQKLSEEEIKKHLIKEDLSELQRCKVLLKKQDPNQQLYVIRNAVSIFRNDPLLQAELLSQLFRMVEKGNEQLQLEAGQSFRLLLKEDIILDREQHLRELWELSKKMLKLWSDESLLWWKKIFVLTLKKLADSSLYSQALSLVVSLTDKSQPLASRKAATYLMGKMAFVFQREEEEKKEERAVGIACQSQECQQWLSKLKTISQDVNWEIRAQAAHAFKYVFRDSSISAIHCQLIAEFEELLEDEEEEVQSFAIDLIKLAVSRAPPEKVQSSLLAKIRKLMTPTSDRQKVDEKLIDLCGEILDAFCQRGSGDDFSAILGWYLQTKLLNSTSRRSTLESERDFYHNLLMSFCFNLPALALHFDAARARECLMPIIADIQGVKESLYNLMVSLPQVIINTKSDEMRGQLLRLVLTQMESAIKEKELTVVSLIVKEIHILYQDYYQLSTRQEFPESAQMFLLVKKQVVLAQSVIDKDWRCYEHYLSFVKTVHSSMDSQHFNKNFVQSLLRNLKKQNHHNRTLITRLLIQILTAPCMASTRSEIHQFMIFDMAASKSSLDRAAYVYFCQLVSAKVSKKYFQEIFLDSFINLLDDKQVAVQVALIKSIKVIRLKVEDVVQINKLENFISAIRTESSKKQFIRDLAEEQFTEMQSYDYQSGLGSMERQREDLNLTVQEMQIYQREREQLELDKKRDVDRVMKQAKDSYFNKINQSFSFSKPSLLGAASNSNQSARQGSATANQQSEYMLKRRQNNLQQIKTAYQVQEAPKTQIGQAQSVTTTNQIRKRSTNPILSSGLAVSNQSRSAFFNTKEENKRDSSADHLAANKTSQSVIANQNTNNFNFQSLFPPIGRHQNYQQENQYLLPKTLTITSGESSMKNQSSTNTGGSQSATNHYSNHMQSGMNAGTSNGNHSNMISSRNLSKPHSGTNVSNTSIIMGSALGNSSSLSTNGRNSYINNSGGVGGSSNFNDGFGSAMGQEFSGGLQNQKSQIPLHPSSLKNRPGRKIEPIQTQQIKQTNYKNISVSPLLYPKKQLEGTKKV